VNGIRFDDLPPRRQAIVLLALAACVSVTAWLMVLRPSWDRLRDARVRLATSEATLAAASARADEWSVVQRHLAETERALIARGATDATDPSAVVTRVPPIAADAGMDLRRVTPLPPREMATSVDWPMDIELRGDIRRVLGFLESLAGLPDVITVEALHIRASAGAPGVDVTCQVVFVQLRNVS
jgi:Tfp pilus assembly protein PilO